MNKTEKEFEALAAEVSEKADRIKCSPAEYREGLATIIAMLEDAQGASKETEQPEPDSEGLKDYAP